MNEFSISKDFKIKLGRQTDNYIISLQDTDTKSYGNKENSDLFCLEVWRLHNEDNVRPGHWRMNRCFQVLRGILGKKIAQTKAWKQEYCDTWETTEESEGSGVGYACVYLKWGY